MRDRPTNRQTEGEGEGEGKRGSAQCGVVRECEKDFNMKQWGRQVECNAYKGGCRRTNLKLHQPLNRIATACFFTSAVSSRITSFQKCRRNNLISGQMLRRASGNPGNCHAPLTELRVVPSNQVVEVILNISHTATPCNTLKHTATNCNKLQK